MDIFHTVSKEEGKSTAKVVLGLSVSLTLVLGAKLFGHAVMHARNQGVSLLFIHALSENVAMLKIARRAGAAVQRDGSDRAALRCRPLTVPTYERAQRRPASRKARSAGSRSRFMRTQGVDCSCFRESDDDILPSLSTRGHGC